MLVQARNWGEYARAQVLQKCCNSRGDDWMYMLKACSDVAIIAPARQLGVRIVVAAPGDGNSEFDIEQPNAWAGTTVCLTNTHDHFCLALQL